MADIKKFLDQSGVSTLWNQVVAEINAKVAAVPTYDDEEVRGLIQGNADAIAEEARVARAAEAANAAALSAAQAQYKPLEKLLLLSRDFCTLLRNFVSFQDFYAKRGKALLGRGDDKDSPWAIFQAGTLVIDQRACNLCLRVNDAAKHNNQHTDSALEHSVPHSHAGFVVTENTRFVLAHVGSRLAEVGIAHHVLNVLPTAIKEHLEIFGLVGQLTGEVQLIHHILGSAGFKGVKSPADLLQLPAAIVHFPQPYCFFLMHGNVKPLKYSLGAHVCASFIFRYSRSMRFISSSKTSAPRGVM